MNDRVKIDGGVVVITGAASGIGAGLARHAASRNMKLVLADWDEERLKNFALELPGETLALSTDVSNEDSVNALADAAFERFGTIDLLFNNAGVMTAGRSWEIDAETWQRSLDVNIGGVVNGMRSFVPRLLAADRPAHIINTASVGGFYSVPLLAPYMASKAAVVAITEALAGELAAMEAKVGVSLLAPGPVKTDLMRDEAPKASAEFWNALRGVADRKGKTPEEFAPLVFAAIERGDFWIIPQPESLDDRLRERTTMVLERRHPADKRGRGK
ncbi:MAG: SDR family NAD(P)-dependent oxidoreductase [Sphingomonadales bacterium]|nr:SDR family NAD(P)-dependent oxidoreductase [Sphingomonadales bacterium]